MYAPITFTQLQQLNSTDTLVLTVNNRFARRLLTQLQYHLLEQVQGQKKAMAVPDILPLSAWLRQANDDLSFNAELAPASYLLDGFSSLHLWEQAIYSQDSEDTWLIDVPQAAKHAAEADQLIDEWALEVSATEDHPDSSRFMQWRQDYKKHLIAHDLDDQNQAAQRVVEALEQAQYLPHWRHVVLVGFHDVSMRLQRLFAALQNSGISLYNYHDDTQEQVQCLRVEAPTPSAEWRLAAQWAAKQLEQNPAGHFAIVALDLQSQAPFARRVLAHELAAGPDKTGFSWNITVGRPLSAWPLVHAALAWLKALAQLSDGRVQSSTLGCALLAGHCVGMTTEQNARAVLDVQLRKNQQQFLSAAEVGLQLDRIELLGGAWRQAQAYLAEHNQSYSPTQWVPHLRQLLSLLGFPGEASLDSHAYQTMQAFDQRLGQFSRLAPIFKNMSLSQLMVILGRFMHETLFQPQRDAAARLDVLGLLEAEGGRWDAIWVLGVTDDVLPAVPNPNPFIPYEVLHQAQAPRSTPERELQWARNMVQALKEATPTLIFSHASQNNGQLLRPSPLIVDIEAQSQPAQDPLVEDNVAPAPMEQLPDNQGPAVALDERVYGGTGLLDKQARNPLWAFVEHRLHAKALVNYNDSGVLRMWRGSFLHYALELFWANITPATGAQLKQDWAQAKAQQWLQQALQSAAEKHLYALPKAISHLELKRGHQVLTRWLELDMQRPDFELVGIEQKHQLLGLATDMRIDRVDQLADGQFVLIDYKTGSTNASYKNWLRARPIDLQLPIYATIFAQQGKEVAGLAFAFMNYEPELAGYGDEGVGLTKTSDDVTQDIGGWDPLKAHLQAQVLAMRDEFLTGYAANHTAVLNTDLHYCEVLPFLRLTQEAIDE